MHVFLYLHFIIPCLTHFSICIVLSLCIQYALHISFTVYYWGIKQIQIQLVMLMYATVSLTYTTYRYEEKQHKFWRIR